MGNRARLLILGGTAEALALAEWAAGQHGLEVITSLAGRTQRPATPRGQLVSGGFGGQRGLTLFLRDRGVTILVDATHPFAAKMAENAVAACETAGVPRIKLLRKAWTEQPGDRWIGVPDMAAAAAALGGLGERVFLSSGRQGIEAFSGRRDHWFLVRLIDPPAEPLPLARHEVILARGPFDEEQEADLLEARRIEAVVSKNSGGASTYGKILAARRLGLPVVMIKRPAAPRGETLESLDSARAWIEARIGA